MSGRLIVFEGVEGCGKTTQLQLLYEWLQRLFSTQTNSLVVEPSGFIEVDALSQKPRLESFTHKRADKLFSGESSPEKTQLNPTQAVTLKVTREPGGTQLGKALRQLLLCEKGAIQDSAELLLYAADRAQHVEEVLKPQLASGAIVLCDRYTDSTIAYQGYGRGLSLSLIHQLNWIATGGLESDLTLWLDVDVAVGLARTKNRGWLDRIEQADLKFHERVRQGYTQLATSHPERIVRVDASLSQENVQQQIRLFLSQRFTEWGLDWV